MAFKPHLAGEGILGEIAYPKLASPKLNGVRGIVQDSTLYARSLKEIPNRFTSALFSRPELEGYDGELVVGPFHDKDVFTTSTSGVMSVAGNPAVLFYAFDVFHPTMPFHERIELLWGEVSG